MTVRKSDAQVAGGATQVKSSTNSRVLFVLWTVLLLGNLINILVEFSWLSLLLTLTCGLGMWTQWGVMRSTSRQAL